MIIWFILLSLCHLLTSKEFSAQIASTHCHIATEIHYDETDFLLNLCKQQICSSQQQSCIYKTYPTMKQCLLSCCSIQDPIGTISQLKKCIKEDMKKLTATESLIVVIIISSLLIFTIICVFGIAAIYQFKVIYSFKTSKLVQQNIKRKQRNLNSIDNGQSGSINPISQSQLNPKLQSMQNIDLSESILDNCPWYKKQKKYDKCLICAICFKRQTDCQTACIHYFHRKCLMNKLIQKGSVGCPQCSGSSLTPLENLCPICRKYYMKIDLPQVLNYETILWVKSFKLCPDCQQEDIH